ncbi:MAG TPA: sterol desaturase family protein [Aliidongia sp.]|nr:sterol desaturase family protein [Aliidongia sp.]
MLIASAPHVGRVRTLASWLIWPLFYCAGLAGTGLALASDRPLVWFNAVYLSIALCIGVLERVMPHEKSWLDHDHQTLTDLAHTLFNKGVVQVIAAILISVTMATAEVIGPEARTPTSLWPHQWPLAVQIILGLVIAELGLYAAHRAAHELPGLWRFHALHHSVERLWVVNTGRFHIVDTAIMIVFSQTPLYLLGAPTPVFLWISGITAVTGLLTHCNIAVRTGPLDFVFATPALHRWHHSKVLEEGNRNYGENIVLWDLIFGTYHNSSRRPPADIGIQGRIAPGFFGQLLQPFTGKGFRELVGGDQPSAAE